MLVNHKLQPEVYLGPRNWAFARLPIFFHLLKYKHVIKDFVNKMPKHLEKLAISDQKHFIFDCEHSIFVKKNISKNEKIFLLILKL